MRKSKPVRVIDNLLWVEPRQPPPFSKGSKHFTGSKAKGLAYQHRIEQKLQQLVTEGPLKGELWIGPWLDFEDANGKGMAQPDAILIQSDRVIIFEMKLKQLWQATPQVKLYGALMSHLLSLPWHGLVIFKWPSQRPNATWISEPQDIANIPANKVYWWNNLG